MPQFFDEMTGADGAVREAYALVKGWLDASPPDQLRARSREAELLFRRIGITFAVYGDQDAEERIIPFDLVPRIITGAEWQGLSRGLEQRVRALNAFLGDIYSRGCCQKHANEFQYRLLRKKAADGLESAINWEREQIRIGHVLAQQHQRELKRQFPVKDAQPERSLPNPKVESSDDSPTGPVRRSPRDQRRDR